MADPLKDWLGKHVGGTTSFGTSAIPELLTPSTESSSNTEGSSSAVVNVGADEVAPSAEVGESSSTPISVQRGTSLATPTREKMEADAAENKQAETMQAAKPSFDWGESFKESADMAGGLVNDILTPVVGKWIVDSNKRARNFDLAKAYSSDYQEAADTSWIASSNPQAIEVAQTEKVPVSGNETSSLVDTFTQLGDASAGLGDAFVDSQNKWADAKGSLIEAMDKEGERKAQANAQAAPSFDEFLARKNTKGDAAIDLLNEDINKAHQERLNNIVEGYYDDGTPIYKGGWEEAADASWIASSNPQAIDLSTRQGVSTKDLLKADKMVNDFGTAVNEGAKSAAYSLTANSETTNPLVTDTYTLQNDPELVETMNDSDREARGESQRKADEHSEKANESAQQFLVDSGVQNIDDGANDEEHRMANKITNEELLRQVESEQVHISPTLKKEIERDDSDTVYYKSDLTRRGAKGLKYNLAGAILDDVATMPNTIQNTVRDARENITSYDVNIDGTQLNSKDIENADLNDQVKSIQDEYIENPKVYLPEADYWYDPNNRIVPYNGGLGYLNEDGDCVVTLMDGTELIFSGNENESPSDEAKRIMKYDLEDVMNNTASSNNTWVKGYATKPVYVGDKEITYDQAYRLLVDMATMDSGGGGYRSDPGITYNFHLGNVAKPAAAYDDDDQWTKMTADAIPYFVDIFTGSAPIMAESSLRASKNPILTTLGYLAPFSNSTGYVAASGLNPYGNRKGGYKKSVGDLTDEVKESLRNQGIDPDVYQRNRKNTIPQQAFANYALSTTEDLWGGVGKSALAKPLKKAGNAIADKSRTARKVGKKLDTSRIYQTVKGGIGEGLEEIPGNIAEEATRSGLTSWYGDYLRDENGNLLADRSGNLLKEQNPSEGVAARFWEDAPESFWAGAMLGVPFSFLGSKRVVNDNKVKHALNKGKYEDANGKFSPDAFDLYNSKAGE